MKGHKGSTIYKSGSCDLGLKHAVRVHNGNKAGSWPAVPELGQSWAGPGLG
jgi:hypothetical protein